jgi:hypothetical protein
MPEPLPRHRIDFSMSRGLHPGEALIKCACGWSTDWQPSHADARSMYNDHKDEHA